MFYILHLKKGKLEKISKVIAILTTYLDNCDPFHKLRFPTPSESLISIQKSVQTDTGTISVDISEVLSYTRAQLVQTISLTCLCKVDSAAVSPVKLDNIKIYIY